MSRMPLTKPDLNAQRPSEMELTHGYYEAYLEAFTNSLLQQGVHPSKTILARDDAQVAATIWITKATEKKEGN